MNKLILFGDSLLNSFNSVMCQAIERQTNYDIYNCAVGGWNTEDGNKKAPYIAQLRPCGVIFSFGTNDAAPWKQIAAEQYKANLKNIFDSFNESKKFFLLPPPINESQLEPRENQRTNILQKQYADAAKAIAISNSVKIIDSWAIFKPMLESGQDYHDEDGVHFNDFGNQTLVGEIVKVINENTYR